MTAAASLKSWYWIHKWSSLVCTLFLLVICITGLPLVFHEELEHLLDDGKPFAVVAEGTPRSTLDSIVQNARVQYRSEEHTSELQSLMRNSYDVLCMKNKKINRTNPA